jgi:hypothetical protein
MVAAAAIVSALGCTPPPEPYDVTQPQWDDGLVRLAALRATFPKKPYTQPLTVTFFEPRSRKRFEGRGAVGVDPGRAMRLILVGPAGDAALDVWVTRTAWRMAVPAIGMRRRGGTESPPGLPVGFFRSWFVDPLGGRPLALGRAGELIVRDDAGGTLDIAGSPDSMTITRRHGTATEVLAAKPNLAVYDDRTTGLEVSIALEPVQSDPPSPQAFDDPGP